jgi:hypothetical protein
MRQLGVGAAHHGKSVVQVSTSQVFLDQLIQHRLKEPVLLLAVHLSKDGLEMSIVLYGVFLNGESVGSLG